MANITFVFTQLNEISVYSERVDGSYPVQEGVTEVLSVIQRVSLRGRGRAQGRIDVEVEYSAQTGGNLKFSSRSGRLRI